MENNAKSLYDELKEVQVGREEIFDGVIVHLVRDTVILPNGSNATREVCLHNGAVCVVPLTDKGEIIMERQFRYAHGRVMLEIPAGKLEPGEDPLDAVKRELEEESGVVASSIEHIGELYTTVALIDEKIQVYLATGLTFKEAHPDEGEFLEVEKIPLTTLVKMVMDGEIKDSKTQIAILKAEKILSSRKVL